ncbi:hypothetical protein AB2N08_18135 [Massilia aurea]|uniref:hypothetical protein n=1 Tax=Massilia aurea TaxID=373040 RepID=UPI0034623C26
MPRKPAARSAPRAARPAVKTAAKPGKVAVPGAAAKSTAPAKAPAKTTVKAAVKTAAKALAGAPARKPAPARAVARSPAMALVDRAPAMASRPALVRDSFTMPEGEYAVLLEVKQACLRAGIDVKKSELLRIGVALLGQLDVATLQGVLAALPQLKTGRPPVQE